MNCGEQIVSMFRDSVSNMLRVLYNQEGEGSHLRSNIFCQLSETYREIWKTKVWEKEGHGASDKEEGGTSLIQYKGVSETQTQVQYTRIFLPWSFSYHGDGFLPSGKQEVHCE